MNIKHLFSKVHFSQKHAKEANAISVGPHHVFTRTQLWWAHLCWQELRPPNSIDGSIELPECQPISLFWFQCHSSATSNVRFFEILELHSTHCIYQMLWVFAVKSHNNVFEYKFYERRYLNYVFQPSNASIWFIRGAQEIGSLRSQTQKSVHCKAAHYGLNVFILPNADANT